MRTNCSAIIVVIIVALAALLGSPILADDNPWSDRAETDLRAIHDLIAADHPGPILDPAFASELDSAFERATTEAARVDDIAGYLYLLMAFINDLPDSHLAVWGARDHPDWNSVPRDPTLYPGFITAWRNGRFVVRDAPDGGPIQDGMALISCDGATMEQLAETNIFSAMGKADQPADWARFGALLLIDQGIIGFERPHTCTLGDGDRTFDITLQWREVSMASLGSAIQHATFGPIPSLGAFRQTNGALWVSLPSFLSDAIPVSAGDAIRTQLAHAADAPYIVFDLRGNGGGNSILADSFAAAAFGEYWVHAWQSASDTSRPPDLIRASTANRTFFVQARDMASGGTRTYFAALVDAIDTAISAGDALATLGGSSVQDAEPSYPEPDYDGTVFIVTDGNAFSSTLLFIELVLRHPNAVHVGWPTRAHGLYGEIRQERLPSGWSWFGFSTKAFMANAGEDHGLVPDIVWEGEIGNTTALQAWIETLAARR